MSHSLIEHATLQRTAPGVYERRADRTWWGRGSLFGGYGLAVALSAMTDEVDDAARPPVALTMHFLRPFLEGALRVEVVVERTGRTMSTVSARLHSEDRLCGLALASFAVPRDTESFAGSSPPPVSPPGADERPLDPRADVPSHEQFWFWPRFGAPVGAIARPGQTVQGGGWVVARDGGPVTFGLLAALGDAWLPSIYGHLEQPTVTMSSDYTTHFREPDPSAVVAASEPLLVWLRTRRAAHGFVDEDTEIWSASGVLLASTRQLRFLQPTT